MGFFDKIKQGLKKTTMAVTEQFSDLMAGFVEIDADTLERLEETLILSDLGATVAARTGAGGGCGQASAHRYAACAALRP